MKNRTWHIRAIFCCLLIFCAQGCVLYPPYERPVVEIPDHWRISANEASILCNVDWWKQFNDPVLDALIEEALAYNNDLSVAIARVGEFEGQLEVIRSGLYPQFSGNVEFLRQESSLFLQPPVPGFPRLFDVFACLLNASYDVDIWGQIRSASDAALAELMASEETRRTVVLTLVTAVATSYIQLRQYDLQWEISKSTYESRVESYKLAQARFVGGLTSELPAKQAEAEMNTAEIQVFQYEISIAQQENLLSVLIGHAPYAIVRGQKLENLTMPPNVPVGLPSEILQQRPDIVAAEDRLIAANAEIGVALAQFFPNFTLTGQFGNESLQLHKLLTNPAETWQYALNIVQPLFTGGRLIGQLDVAEGVKCEAYYEYRQTVLNAFKEVDDALIAHQKSFDILKVEQLRVAALKEALHLAILQYENGQVDYLNVLDEQRNLFRAELSWADSLGFTFFSLINLYKALGGGWVMAADTAALNEE